MKALLKPLLSLAMLAWLATGTACGKKDAAPAATAESESSPVEADEPGAAEALAEPEEEVADEPEEPADEEQAEEAELADPPEEPEEEDLGADPADEEAADDEF